MGKYYELEGVVDEVGERKVYGSWFEKRDLVVDTPADEKWKNPVKVQFRNEKCGLLDGIAEGRRVKVRFALDGRRWDGPEGAQYFMDLVGLAIEAESAAQPSAPAEPPSAGDDGVADDVPF